ncbi:MAG: hypothetical protein HFG58_10660 [Lachnospiraceae bacterium]|jgi:predicted RNA-binding Zn-ribbon protein involved in translation (DUF1610 family)|nr:hypothetical protein [Lachnospiraceae bacterium]
MDEVRYCEKCGYVGHVLFNKKCKNCKIKMKILSEEMKQKYNIFNDSWAKIGSQLNGFANNTIIGTINEELALREELISRTNNFVMNELADNPIFSLEAYNIQIEKKRETNKERAEFHHQQSRKQQAKNLAKMQQEKDKQNCIPKCPICGSTNINKITIGNRAVKTAVFGVVGAVDDAGKTYKCNNCGSKF